jgi:hypothetical protein
MNERDYMTGQGIGGTADAANHYLARADRNAFASDPGVAPSLADEAAHALSLTDSVHTMLDDLEFRVFGPEPRAIQGSEGVKAGNEARQALAHSVKGTRQRLESATERLSRILGRL